MDFVTNAKHKNEYIVKYLLKLSEEIFFRFTVDTQFVNTFRAKAVPTYIKQYSLKGTLITNRLNLEVMTNNTLACAIFEILLYCKFVIKAMNWNKVNIFLTYIN